MLNKTFEYLMHCYFLHQEKREEIMAQHEDLLTAKSCQYNQDVQKLTIDMENAHRKIEVICLHT